VRFAGQLNIVVKICLHYFPGPSRPKLKLDPEAKAELAFNVFDKNHDGYVTKNEMLKVSKNLTKEQVDAVFERNDNNHDGKLNLQEFQEFMQHHQDKKKN